MKSLENRWSNEGIRFSLYTVVVPFFFFFNCFVFSFQNFHSTSKTQIAFHVKVVSGLVLEVIYKFLRLHLHFLRPKQSKTSLTLVLERKPTLRIVRILEKNMQICSGDTHKKCSRDGHVMRASYINVIITILAINIRTAKKKH